MRFRDFTLQIDQEAGGRIRARVLQSPAGEGSLTFDLPFAPSEIPRLLGEGIRAPGELRSASRHLVAAGPSGGVADLADLGRQLFDRLFSGQIGSLFDRSLGGLGAGQGLGLRIKIKVDPTDPVVAALASIPWELLHRRETGEFLCLSRASPIVRYVDVPRPPRPVTLPRPLRVLIASASPGDLPPLEVNDESRRLLGLFDRRGLTGSLLEHAGVEQVRRALLDGRHHALHFMGHGALDPQAAEGVLYFEDAKGRAEAVSGRALSAALSDLDSLGVVCLNACETARSDISGSASAFAGVANALVLGGLPAVVAMQFPISDRAAVRFSEAFYRRLAAGDAVDLALTEGRQAIHAGAPGSLEWATPVLFMRVPDGQVFQPRAPRARRRWATVAVIGFTGGGLLAVPFARPALQQWLLGPLQARLDGSFQVEVDQDFATSVPGLLGRVRTVELLDGGRMRLHLEFRSESADAQPIRFDLGRTYLADEAGNRYSVLERGEAAATVALAGGGVVRHALEFPAPRDGATTFKVGLVPEDPAAKVPLFPLSLSAYPPRYSVATEPAQLPAEAVSLEVPAPELASDVAGFAGRVARVELLPDHRMRWKVSLFNGSEADQEVSLHFGRLVLVDEFGNRYPVLASSVGAAAVGAANAYRGLVQRAVRADFWFEFPGPWDGAQRFRLVLANDSGIGPAFAAAEFALPAYPRHYSVPRPRKAVPAPHQAVPEPAPAGRTLDEPAAEPTVSNPPVAEPPAPATRVGRVVEAEILLPTSLPGLSAGVLAVDRLSTAGLRLLVEIQNSSAQTVGAIEPGATYLADDLGTQYRALRAGAEPGASACSAVLAPGSGCRIWLEFSRPKEAARSVYFVLGGGAPARFTPVRIELGE